jgi:hypothetical protein
MELEHGRVAHTVPGRVRIKLDPHALTEERAPSLRLALLSVPHIEEVQTTPRTGSIVIIYDARHLDVRRLIARLRDAQLLALDPPVHDPYAGQSKPMSDTARGIHRAFHGVDMQLSQITGGKWDLRSAMPFALGALALRQLLANPGTIASAPWYVFAWYAFDSFWKLNLGQTIDTEADEDESASEDA